MKDYQVNKIKSDIAKTGAWPFPKEKPAELPTINGTYNGGLLTMFQYNEADDDYTITSDDLPVDEDGCHVLPNGECVSTCKCIHSPLSPDEFNARMEKDPSGMPLNQPGAKADAGKILPWLMISGFARALEEVSRVTTEGASKYSPNGWMQVSNAQERYLNAFGRHLLKYAKGEVFDTDLKDCYHLAQMAWNILAVLELKLTYNE